MPFTSRLSCGLQADSGRLSDSIWDFSTQLYLVGTCCMVNPVLLGSAGPAAPLDRGCAGPVAIPGSAGLAACATRLPDTFWQCQWSCCVHVQLRQHFSEVAGCLQALSGYLLEFCRHAAAQAGSAAALAGLCRLSNRGQMQEFWNCASQNWWQVPEEMRLVVKMCVTAVTASERMQPPEICL